MHPIAVIAIAIVCFIFGFLARSILSQSGKREKKLNHALNQARADIKSYQTKVHQHMSKTADLITGFNKQFESLQEHVFSGANRLNKDISKQSVLQPTTHLNLEATLEESTKMLEVEKNTIIEHRKHDNEQPIDYAPKEKA